MGVLLAGEAEVTVVRPDEDEGGVSADATNVRKVVKAAK